MSHVITIVTACRNASASIDRTILSVITQAGDFRIRYHVQDGGSVDGTRDRLAWWQARLDDPQSPVFCRDVWFSHDSAPDGGEQDGMRAGFAGLTVPPEAFMTWLPAGGILLNGALAHVAALAQQFGPGQLDWLSGAVPLIRDHRLVAVYDVPVPTDLLRRAPDGGPQPQGPMFFRRHLWADAAAQGGVQSLWRHFAGQADLVQTPLPLGIFQPMTLPMTAPDTGPRHAPADGPLWRHRITGDGSVTPLRIVAQDVAGMAHHGGEHAPPPAAAPRLLHEGGGAAPSWVTPATRSAFTAWPAYRDLLGPASQAADAAHDPRFAVPDPVWPDPVWRGPGILACDQGWQDGPATEWRAFRQMRAVGAVPEGITYIAYPWARLIDRLRHDPGADMTRFRAFCAAVPKGCTGVTVCQHPQMLDHLALLTEAGIADVFWPCVTPLARQRAARHGVTLHAFPHSPDGTVAAQAADHRPDLLALLTSDAAGLTGRFGRDPARSLFALCPAGVGGNSPALWQAVAAGAVPVILTEDGTDGLPGNPALWPMAALFCTVDETQTLPDRLRAIAQDPGRLAALRHGLHQIRLLYGPEAFVTDIQMRMAERAATRAGASLAQPNFARPNIARRTPPRIFFLGPRSARTPLGYAPFRRMAAARMTVADTPATADLILTGWSRDLEENAAALAPVLAARPGIRLAVISEEPLWDTVWSGGFAARDRVFDGMGTPRPYRFLNHMNSGIFAFDRIPYFLLTADAFCARHVPLLAGFAARSPQDMLRHWQQAPLRAAFFAEHRSTAEFDLSHPAHQVTGLSAYRTAVASLTPGPAVLRVGQGWPAEGGVAPRRQDLPDWHLDKLAQLHGRLRVCAAYENTHQRDYISEKLFDAFAVGAVPLCYAGPEHRLHDLVVPGAVLNTFGDTPAVAAGRIAALTPDLALAEAWLATVARLAAVLGDAEAVLAERRRVLDAVFAEIAVLL